MTTDPRTPIWRGPRHRPSTGWRVALGGITVAVLLVSGLILLSDRAPGFLRQTFGDRAKDLWDRIAASGTAGFLTDGGRPEADLAVHVVIWFVLTVLIALTIWTWWGLVATGIGMIAFGLLVEIAQGALSSTRSVERSDLEADVYGTVFGLVAALVVMVVWALVQRIVVSRRPAPAPVGSTSAAAPPERG